MALITCPECEREVSDKAHSCPGCGYPVAAANKSQSQDDSQHEESLASLIVQGVKNVTEEATAEDVKKYLHDRGSGLFQVVVSVILILFTASAGIYPITIIAIIFLLRGLYVTFGGHPSNLSR